MVPSCLAKCVLASPAAGHKLRWRKILRCVRSPLQRLFDGDLAGLWSDAQEDGHSLLKHSEQSLSSSTSHNIRRAKLATYMRVFILRPSKSSHQMFWPRPLLRSYRRCLTNNPTLHPLSLKSFPNASAPGPSGLRPSHLCEAVLYASPDCVNYILSALTRFTNLLATGRTPPSVLSYLCGATLLVCLKAKGGHRPILVGEVLCCLTSKHLAAVSCSLAFTSLTPLQLDVGVRRGM